MVTDTVAGTSSRASARCRRISRSRSRHSVSLVYGTVIAPPKPIQKPEGSWTTAAMVSRAWLDTATLIAWCSAAHADGDPSKATSTRCTAPPPASGGVRKSVSWTAIVITSRVR